MRREQHNWCDEYSETSIITKSEITECVWLSMLLMLISMYIRYSDCFWLFHKKLQHEIIEKV